MSAEALVRELNALGVYPFVEGGKLKAKALNSEIPADIVDRIRLNKEALIGFLADPKTASLPPASAIAAGKSDTGRYPLSFSQRRLWFIDQLEGGGSQYNMPTALQLHGDLDADAIEWSLGEIVRRHAVLRSTYANDGGEPVQIVHEPREFRMRRLDLSSLPPEHREEQLRNACREEFERPFDLASDPMLRACAIALQPDHHVLIVNLHHIACDGWSKGVLTRELVELYRDRVQGRGCGLQPLPIQYSDYAQWQQGAEFAERVEDQFAYWQRQLSDIPKVHGLRLDKPRPAQQQFAGDVHVQELGAELLGRLNAVALAHQATLFMVLQTAFSLLVGRWSQERTVVVGSPTAGRLRQELEPMIGFFVNTLVLKTELEEGLSFSGLLARGRSTALEAYANQEVPFEMLVERLQPERSLSHSPLFQILFALQNNDYGVLELPGLRIEGLATEGMVNRFDLEVFAGERDGGLTVAWNFATSLFQSSTIAAMAASFAVLLDAIARDPGCDIHRLPLVTPDDLACLQRWRDECTAVDPATCAGIHEMFEAAAAAFPQEPAVLLEGARLSYDALNRRANQVAHGLIARGVGRDSLVGISVERSLDLIVGVLAILKAGAAYVAFDPAYPPARLEYMLHDSNVEVVLTSRQCPWRLPEARGLSMLIDAAAQWASYPDENPRLPVDPGQLAYTIYTSGSTGKPKGIVLPHRVLTNLVTSQYRRYPAIARRLPTLQFATLNFDMSIYEIMTALCNGSPLVMIRDQERMSLARLGEVLQDHRVGRMYLPTAMLGEFCQYAVESRLQLPSLELIQVAGEALTINDDVRRFFQAAHGCRLLNLYGPSETHVVTDFQLEGDPARWPVAPSIGHAIHNAELFVLDEYMNEVPIGVAGELFIGGPVLAREYLNLTQMTAEKFLQPAATGRAGRLYRTGDLVRHGRDGALQYLGRIGRQVKVRGFRIELDEIEQCLLKDPRVADAVVLAIGEAGDKALVAWLILDALQARPGGSASALDEIRAALAGLVPDYMIPATFVVVDRFELTANGKVDVARLPAPDLRPAETRVEPAEGLELAMAGIWAALLKKPLEDIGATSSFFALGGHSLLAMRLVNRIEQELGFKTTVRSIFVQPTIRGLCGELSTLQHTAFERMAVADRERPLPLSYSQQRLWYIDRLEGGSSQYHLPTALRLHGDLDLAALQASFDRIVERHEILRTVYETRDGAPLQRVLPARPVSIRQVDLGGMQPPLADADLADRLREAALRPFDLARDQMIRVDLFTIAPGSHMLLCTLHHVASDGWSMGVLTRELAALYRDHAQGRPESLAPMTVQYGDFAVWQRDPEQVRKLDQQLAFWTAHLADLPPVHSLPLDRQRPHEPCYDGGSHRQVLDPLVTKAVNQFARDCDATLFMCLQGALSVVLMRWSNAHEIAVGSPVAGRSRGDLDGSIGLYVNTLVFRHRLEEGSTFRQEMRRSRQLALDAYAHQDVPFEMLVEALRPARSLGHAPLFQVMFVLQNNEQVELELAGVRIEGIELGASQIKFDLSLSVREVGDELVMHWSYAQSLFDPATVSRLAQSFETFLRAALAAPDREVRQVAFAPAPDLEHYDRWNQTRTDYPDDACIHEMFRNTAQRLPDAIAVRDDRCQLSYAQLDALSDAVARMLVGSGLGIGARVAVCMDPSAELIASLLGVMKCGASYIPLELKNTPSRMRSILEDAAVDMVLGIRGLADGLADARVAVVALDDCLEQGWGTQWRMHALPAEVSSEASAYVIYTSGSTGTPKGVDVHHRGLTEYCVFAGRNYYQPWLAGSLVVTSHGFDITVPSLYLPLLDGGCVDLLPQQDILHRVAKILAGPRCDSYLLRMTPMHVHALLAIMPEGHVDPARHVFVIGGERFLPGDARALQAMFPASTVYNHYGPSETVVGCCMYDISQDIERLGEVLPIGRAMSNTCLFVLDQAMQRVPIGVAGELYIGGDCVSKGYVNRPDLTRERFVANPFGPDWAPRLYRTGDLVHFDAQGRLVFLGRVDEQIKLRGFRIEPMEIEAHIAAVDGVDKAVVVAAGEGEHQYLAAYLVPKRELAAEDADQAELVARVRRSLRLALPDYLNPAVYVCIERLPLSANGKLDRKALPAPQQARAEEISLPANPTESALREIWASVLAVEPDSLGTTSGFFDIGGHSLLAIMLIEAVNRRMGAGLPLSSLYTAATIRDQAALLAIGDAGQDNQAVVLQSGSTDAPLFLVHPVGGDVLCYRQLVRELHLDCAVYGIQHEAFTTTQPVSLKSVEELAEDYCARIRRLQPHGPYRLAGWSLGGVIALAIAHRLEADGETVAYLGMLDSVLDHTSASWLSLQGQVDRPDELSAYMAMLHESPDAIARFDAAYRLGRQSDGDTEATRERLRAVIVAGVVAARRFQAKGDVRRLHYYSASRTAEALAAGSIDRLLGLSRQPARSRAFDADHFSLLQTPAVGLLAASMRADLIEAAQTTSTPIAEVSDARRCAPLEGIE